MARVEQRTAFAANDLQRPLRAGGAIGGGERHGVSVVGHPPWCDPQPFTMSLRPLPALNFGALLAAIWIFSPVRGLRPSEAARAATEKLPKPTRRTSSPALADQSAKAETVRARLQRRPGFEQLDPIQAMAVLAPVSASVMVTSADAVAPPLTELRDLFPLRLSEAEDEANARLDELLERVADTPVKPLRLALKGREIATEADLELLVTEIREQIGALVRRGVRVRIQ